MQTVTMEEGWAFQPDSEPVAKVQVPREPGRPEGSIRMADDFDAIDNGTADLFEDGARRLHHPKTWKYYQWPITRTP